MPTASLTSLFYFNKLSILIIALVGFLGLTLVSFSRRYLDGDKYFWRFLLTLIALCISVIVVNVLNHLLLLSLAWFLSNFLLVMLMIHKQEWAAAKASGILAAETLSLGGLFVAAGFFLLFLASGKYSLQAIVESVPTNPLLPTALCILLIGACAQSAIYPFHRWLVSSLNSPTPVSAIMHAGLINGGGLLIIRFAPLYLAHAWLLDIMLVLGLFTALTGTLWKLLQNDNKRMLACSTMAQMGFMLLQCGLGLFSAAAIHLCWHGLFKAYQFLNAGNAAHEKITSRPHPVTALAFVLSLLCGLFGSFIFALASKKGWFHADSTSVLISLSLIASAQVALSILSTKPLANFFVAGFVSTLFAFCYGKSVDLVSVFLAPLHLDNPQPLTFLHIGTLALISLAWLAFVFKDRLRTIPLFSSLILLGYVRALNASQPHPLTVTSHHNHYRYR